MMIEGRILKHTLLFWIHSSMDNSRSEELYNSRHRIEHCIQREMFHVCLSMEYIQVDF